MNVRPLLFTVSLSFTALAGCEKKPDATAADAMPAAPATTTPASATAAGATAAGAMPAASAAGVTAVAPGKPVAPVATGVTVAATPGGTVVAANGNGKVLVNDAGVVTAKRANGDSVTTTPTGVTANGVTVDNKKGTVVVPGVGTFAAPPH
jgi:hypothetical protein